MDDKWFYFLVGGLGIFFYGMKLMSDGLKKIAGERLKKILHMVTTVPLVGVLVGAVVTVIIQSSSATTVMVVGFVNAGLLTLKQAITVIMGANVGTTFTAWLVSSMGVFKITKYAMPAIGLGYVLMTFGKTQKWRSFGEVMMGFGMLFLGLDFLKDAFGPLKSSEFLKSTFVQFSTNPILGVLAGIVFTVLLQSSSATIAIVQLLAFNGMISFDAAIPVILGDNIGTTITAQMAAMAGTNIHARRAAMSHTVFNVIGVSYMLVFVYFGWYSTAIDAIIPGSITTTNIMFHIAVAHSAFNVFNVLVFLPFTGFLEKASIALVRQKEGEVELGTQYLERHLLDTPSLAMEQAQNETIYMLKVSRKAAASAMDAFLEEDMKKVKIVFEYEAALDNLQAEITQYLVDLSLQDLAKEDLEELPVWIHVVNDIERIGDQSQNIAELARRKAEEKMPFTDQAVEEMKVIWQETLKMFEDADKALREQNVELAHQMLEREKRINQLHDQFKAAHISRLNEGQCNLQSGFIFLDFLDNIEKIGDRLTNVAQSVIGHMKWSVKHKKQPV